MATTDTKILWLSAEYLTGSQLRVLQEMYGDIVITKRQVNDCKEVSEIEKDFDVLALELSNITLKDFLANFKNNQKPVIMTKSNKVKIGVKVDQKTGKEEDIYITRHSEWELLKRSTLEV